MSFLYPTFLWALAAIAIPIIIHLFNFRSYRTVYFSNLRFLKDIKQETKSQSRLKHWLVLLLRILAIIALVLAFAQPYIPVSQKLDANRRDLVSVYIDNSFSMDAEGTYGKLLEVAKKQARSIAEAYPNDAMFLLLTNDFDLKHQHPVGKEQFLDFVDHIEPGPVVRPLSEVYSRQLDFAVPDQAFRQPSDSISYQATLYWLSDFQQTSSDIENLDTDTAISLQLIPLSSQQANNLYIDSLWFETPYRVRGGTERLYVQVVNRSTESYEDIPMRLLINDSLKAIESFNCAAEASQIVELTYTNSHTGNLHGRIEITDYPITYDNDFYFAYRIAEKVNLLIINDKEPNKFLEALFADDENFQLTYFSRDNIQANNFGQFHSIIVNGIPDISSGLAQEFVNFMAGGGTLIFFPHQQGDIESYNRFLGLVNSNLLMPLDTQKVQLAKLNDEHIIYRNAFKNMDEDVSLPVIFEHFPLTRQTRANEETILSTETDHPIVSSLNYEKGRLYIANLPLSNNNRNFMQSTLFVPTVYNMALFSTLSDRIYYIIGHDEVVAVESSKAEDSDQNVLHVSQIDGTFDFIPQQMNSPQAAIRLLNLSHNSATLKAGNYNVLSREQAIKPLAFNYNRTESDLRCYTNDELKEIINKQKLEQVSLLQEKSDYLTKSLREVSQGRKYWKILIIMALVFLAVEIALLRLWR